MPLNVASINVEGQKHRPRILAFLEREKPDVLCMQELHPEDVPDYEAYFNQKMLYVPVNDHGRMSRIGIGIIANRPLYNTRICDYTGHPEPQDIDPMQISEMLAFATVLDGSTEYRIGTTHMRVTRDGESTPAQMDSVHHLLAVTQREAESHRGLLLTGDFNAPRGNPAFQRLADVFIDGVPAHYKTSLDPELHYAAHKKLERMVDGFFLKRYQARGVKLEAGVSDHQAVVGKIAKAA